MNDQLRIETSYDVLRISPAQGLPDTLVIHQAASARIVMSEQGSQGVPGDSNTYGWNRLNDDEYSAESPQVIAASTRTLLQNDGEGGAPSSRLSGGFQAHDFLDADRLRSMLVGDAYLVRLSFMAEASVMNTSLKVELDIGGAVGTIQGERPTLPLDAGDPDLVTCNFQSNGAGVYLTASSQLSVWGAEFLVLPHTRGTP